MVLTLQRNLLWRLKMVHRIEKIKLLNFLAKDKIYKTLTWVLSPLKQMSIFCRSSSVSSEVSILLLPDMESEPAMEPELYLQLSYLSLIRRIASSDQLVFLGFRTISQDAYGFSSTFFKPGGIFGLMYLSKNKKTILALQLLQIFMKSNC